MDFDDNSQYKAIKKLLVTCRGLFVIFILVSAVILEGSPAAANAQTSPAATSTAVSSSSLQSQLDANNQEMVSLNQQIATYQAELQQVGANKKTLQAAINGLDLQKKKVQTQISLTQYQIQTTQLQIQQLGGEIADTQQTVAADQTSLGAYLRSLQKADAKPLIQQMLSSGGLVESWSDLNQTLQIQNGIQNEMQTLKEQEDNLSSSQTASQQKQNTLTAQQQSLTAQQQSLVSTEQSKSQLLTETNAQEATYEKLLAAAEAELNSFSAFAANAGGSKLLGNQTTCDSWGCYYSQRDSAWGSLPLDGTKYSMAADGCLVTAMAMVLTHYGYKDVTPETINANPNNFAAYYPAYLLTSINVDGQTASRKTATIDATLATGNPVIVGINAYGGTHFVVSNERQQGQLHNEGSVHREREQYQLLRELYPPEYIRHREGGDQLKVLDLHNRTDSDREEERHHNDERAPKHLTRPFFICRNDMSRGSLRDQKSVHPQHKPRDTEDQRNPKIDISGVAKDKKQGCRDHEFQNINEHTELCAVDAMPDGHHRNPGRSVILLPPDRDREEVRHLPREHNEEQDSRRNIYPTACRSIAYHRRRRACDGTDKSTVHGVTLSPQTVRAHIEDKSRKRGECGGYIRADGEDEKSHGTDYRSEHERIPRGDAMRDERAMLCAFHLGVDMAIDIIIDYAPGCHHEIHAQHRGKEKPGIDGRARQTERRPRTEQKCRDHRDQIAKYQSRFSDFVIVFHLEVFSFASLFIY